jgi:hypothetical protein
MTTPMKTFAPFESHGPEIVQPSPVIPFSLPFWLALLRGYFGVDAPISTVHKGLAGLRVVDQLMSIPGLGLFDVTILQCRCSGQDPHPLPGISFVPINPFWDVQSQLRLGTRPRSCSRQTAYPSLIFQRDRWPNERSPTCRPPLLRCL